METVAGSETYSFPKTVLVDVTQMDIDEGEPRNAHACAMYRAFHRTVLEKWPGAVMSVGMTIATVYGPNDEILATYDLSKNATSFIDTYDARFTHKGGHHKALTTAEAKAKVKPARFRFTLSSPLGALGTALDIVGI